MRNLLITYWWSFVCDSSPLSCCSQEFQKFGYNMFQCGSLSSSDLELLNIYIHIFHQIEGILAKNFPSILSAHFSLPSFWDAHDAYLGPLADVPQVFLGSVCSLVFSPLLLISIVLSSLCSNLPLNPWSQLFTSVNDFSAPRFLFGFYLFIDLWTGNIIFLTFSIFSFSSLTFFNSCVKVFV